MNSWRKYSLAAWCVFALVATCLSDVQLVYRGRLSQRSGAPVTEPLTISFNLYESETEESSLWGLQRQVTPDAQGSIEAILADGLPDVTYLVADATLTNVVRTGKARFIGVKVQDGRELLPRQTINAQPYAREARLATGLAQASTVGRLNAKKLSTQRMYFDRNATLTVTQKLKFDETNANVHAELDLDIPASALPIRVRGGGAQPVWGDWKKCTVEVDAHGNFVPPVDGVYLLTTLPNLHNAILALWNLMLVDSALGGWWAPGLVFFGRKGRTTELPYVGQQITGKQPTIYYRPFNYATGN